MIVFAWLRKEPMDLKTFVQNRVAKIQELYPNQLWRHVPSDQNPADLVSRGVDPDKLLFVENLKGINKVAGPLTTKEFEKAETFLVKKVQEQEFSSDINHLKTVHIELVSDLTSQAFIAALKRFMARRGKCAKLFSDNGKNFVGASNEIKKLLEIVRNPDEKLANYLAAEGIEWKFIPARSPNFGGLWEAAIKSLTMIAWLNQCNVGRYVSSVNEQRPLAACKIKRQCMCNNHSERLRSGDYGGHITGILIQSSGRNMPYPANQVQEHRNVPEPHQASSHLYYFNTLFY
ncbi:integrase catalytic domain-containing protein [Trichonephila clavipes]|nr:integrase catalytic domain-containing protein [Trichonephila clavipes]